MEKVTPRAVLLVHITTFSAKYLKNGLAGEEGRPHRIQVHLSIFKFRQKVTSKKRIEREKWLFKSNTLDPPSMTKHRSESRQNERSGSLSLVGVHLRAGHKYVAAGNRTETSVSSLEEFIKIKKNICSETRNV